MYIQRYVCSDLSGYVHVKMFTAGFNPICLWFCVRVLVEGLYILCTVCCTQPAAPQEEKQLRRRKRSVASPSPSVSSDGSVTPTGEDQ